MAMICGIDEAGRGPVIGPMVMAGVTMEEADIPKLEKLGVKDSKLIAPKRREELFEKIIAIVDKHIIEQLSPVQIDAALKDPDSNLNWLEATTSAEIINRLDPDKAIIDCPSNNIGAYTDYLKKRLKTKTQLIVEHKADAKYLIAGAASILAKVTRDRAVKELRDQHGDFGSGYPSDPKTKRFIQENHELPIYRRTWDTWKQVAESKKQKRLGDF